jgi:aerotaxis receptor
MKQNYPVSGHENNYPADIHIVSTTDEKGIIEEFNEDFVKVCGFSPEELSRKNHNVVRHPDMPPAAFANLWTDIKQGKPWMGIVKNRCKNGDHYWVDAYVIPIYDGRSIAGYQSVRTKPDREHVARAEALYQQINHGATVWQQLRGKLQLGIMGKVFWGCLAVLAPVLWLLSGNASLGMLALAAALGVTASALMAKLIAAPWQAAAQASRDVFANAVAQHVFTGRADELGQLQLVIKAQQARLTTVLWRIDEAAKKLDGFAAQTAAVVEQTNQGINQQQSEIEQVATAMNEMSATVHEVAQNASIAAQATEQADREVMQGKRVVSESIDGINRLAQEVERASQAIGKLAVDSQQIGSVVDVIRGIADQTNLLALNAAIEAARAGEQGRGFAVVADEVRTLASRTQESTDEIQRMIQNLQRAADDAVKVMEEGQRISAASVEQANHTGASLEAITQAVARINDMAGQIATAAEEQSAVSEEISRNVVSINMVAEQTTAASGETARDVQELVQEATALRELVRQFGIK